MLASGALQVAGTVAATALAFRALALPWPAALFTGFLVSLSSTAIVFKLYDEEGELDAPQGLAAAGILLFQDLAMVPMMLLVPVLASAGGGAARAALGALLEGTTALAAVLVLARAVLPRVLGLVARARTPELFPLAALVVAFGTALGAARLGLSLPIGAFLAGLALSGSLYAHQVFAELLPLRDAFVAIFFTSIGMLFEPAAIAGEPALLAGMVGAVLFKGLLITAIVGLFWRSTRLAVLTGFGLAQIGEFSFVLARQGGAAGVISRGLEQVFLGAAIVTMAATPFLMRLGRRLALLGAAAPGAGGAPELRDHVLVIGYGITGQAVARVLRETGVPFVAVDLVTDVVEAGRREGIPVRFGDASRRAVLEEMGAERARAAVVAVGDPAATRRIVSLVRQTNASARILVRAPRGRDRGAGAAGRGRGHPVGVRDLDRALRAPADAPRRAAARGARAGVADPPRSLPGAARRRRHARPPRAGAEAHRGRHPRDRAGDAGEPGGGEDAGGAGPPAVAAAKLRPARDEGAAARERGALLGGERRKLARPRPRGPVRVGLGRRDLLDPALDAHLLPEAIPVEGDGRARARAQLAALAAAAVGEEDEAAAVGALQEDEADRGRAPTPGGGERHRLGERDTGARGGPEPAAEARERLGQGTYSTPQEKTRAGVTSTITTSDSSSAAWSGYCGYFA